MLAEFKLPELGENIESADIVSVLIKAGDKVAKDQVVFEIETDKATVEVPSEVEGIVKDVKIKEGEKAEVGQILFTVESNGDSEESADKREESKASHEEADQSREDKKASESKEVETVSESKQEETKRDEDKAQETGLKEFKLPDLGENIESADITKVLVSEGERIEKDQAVVEIETDKATVEVPSEFGGVVKELFVKDGETAKVGQKLFTIESSSAPVQEKEAKVSADRPAVKSTHDIRKDVKEEKAEEPEPAKLPWQTRKMPDKIAPAAPSVRRFAREIGIDIHNVKGSGPGGRISVDDVKAYAKNLNQKIAEGGAGAPLGIKAEPLPDFSKWGEIEVEPMTNIRRKTAEHLSFAWASIPHVTQFDSADITDLEVIRKKYAKKAEAAGGKLTVTSILLKIAASALKVFPQFNASIDMDKKEIIFKKYFSIGVAVDTDRGLLVPVVRDVDKKNIFELSAELRQISEKARDRKLSLEDMQGGNFSISNLGGIGGTYFTPIVNSPEVAILGVSRGSYQPVLKDDKFEPRLILPISLSYDHRIIDGADAARFLRWIAEALENPILLSLEG